MIYTLITLVAIVFTLVTTLLWQSRQLMTETKKRRLATTDLNQLISLLLVSTSSQDGLGELTKAYLEHQWQHPLSQEAHRCLFFMEKESQELEYFNLVGSCPKNPGQKPRQPSTYFEPPRGLHLHLVTNTSEEVA